MRSVNCHTISSPIASALVFGFLILLAVLPFGEDDVDLAVFGAEPVCLFGISGGFRRWTTIEIPKAILELPIDEQLAAVPELMRAYKLLCNGAVPFFDMLTGSKLSWCGCWNTFSLTRTATSSSMLKSRFDVAW
jgi:hypothetical protein